MEQKNPKNRAFRTGTSSGTAIVDESLLIPLRKMLFLQR
jgi:hypothetical protein